LAQAPGLELLSIIPSLPDQRSIAATMAFVASSTIFGALLVISAPLALAVGGAHVRLQGESLATVPMHLYKQDCWQKRPIKVSMAQIPGAGMTPEALEPFKTVLKDGFYQVDCINDYMLEHGDKFGNNKFSYELGDVSNVSIVRYSDTVPKEDQEPMSHDTCFAFCRTVPDMMFFGIANGRDCYCTPYYKPMAGDDSMCDLVCEGDNTMMCGGKSKSNIFEMHDCANTKADIVNTASKMTDLSTDMTALEGQVADLATAMQGAATTLQESFGKAGDPVASDLMQSAKIFAGEMEHTAEGAKKLAEDMQKLKTAADDKKDADFSVFATASAGDSLVKQMEQATAQGEVEIDELEAFTSKYSAASNVSSAGKQYYPVMYFVDKSFESMPSTCGGKAAGSPLVADFDSCAASCDATAGCVGFSHFPHDSLDGKGLCFPFLKLTSVTYYTECASSTFLQRISKAAEKSATKCVAKLSNFEGTTLKPDPSGKCEQCLKTATKAARCFD